MSLTPLFRGRVRCIHFIGIGGIGMSGIAEILLNLGFDVHGSDMKSSDVTERLVSKGAQIHIGHRRENIKGADVIVRSTAVKDANPEVQEGFVRGIPVIPRAEMLAELMRLKHGIAIAGAHGKTTTTSLIATVLHAAGLDPTVVIGGKLNQLGSNARLGQGDYLVAEADESDGSFLKLSPAIAVVTNIDLEHVDYWTEGLEQIKDGFATFLNRLPFYGLAVVCIDEPNVQSLLPRLARRVVTYGKSRQADYQASNITTSSNSTRFQLSVRGGSEEVVETGLVGEHNVLNSLAAIAVADELGVPLRVTSDALQAFAGVDRRLTKRGEEAGVVVIDDYGHHPTEIRATLQAVRQAHPDRRVVVLFQPHRYSRTAGLLDDFGRAFNDADVLRIVDVYAAGEAVIESATSEAMADLVRRQGHRDAKSIGDLDSAILALCDELQRGDLVVTLGAGTITTAGVRILNALTATRGHS
jgi:UDP-N-acetylmuramate--alanine ligase